MSGRRKIARPKDWEAARTAHRNAVAAFLERAGALADAAWNAPVSASKWSPAQIAEHLRLSYEILRRELEGGEGLRLRTSVWMRPWLRLRYLGRILRSGWFPTGARAVREVRPGGGPFPRADTLAALQAAAAAFEAALGSRWSEPGTRITHPYFGRLRAPEAMTFVTVHTEHHLRQLPSRQDPPA